MQSFNILLLGDCGVGKSCFLQRLKTGHFHGNLAKTIGVGYENVRMEAGRRRYRLGFWDAAGSPMFTHLIHKYYAAAHGVMIFFDASKPIRKQSIEKWVLAALEHCTPDTAMMLVGTHADCGVQHELGRDTYPMDVVHVGTRDGYNVREAVVQMVHQMARHAAPAAASTLPGDEDLTAALTTALTTAGGGPVQRGWWVRMFHCWCV